jgi:beta-glucosidase
VTLLVLTSVQTPLFARETPDQPRLSSRATPVITIEGLRFRDLNRNSRLDSYEDWRLPVSSRVEDLLRRMTLEEKAATMLHASAPAVGNPFGIGSSYDVNEIRRAILERHLNAFNTRLSGNPAQIAEENNKLQAIAESARLGIPLTISTDPRNSTRASRGAAVTVGGFSKWPDSIGLAAIGDADLVRRYGDIVRQEHRATGIHESLSPQVDLPTEPRWPRINGTFGENARLARSLTQSFVEGLQGSANGVTRDGVLANVKHWAGYSAAKDGWDSHNHYGRFSTFEGRDIRQHLMPFEGAFAAKVAGVMPTYSILQNAYYKGHKIEELGAGFNKFLLTDLLRGIYGFRGKIISDFAITEDCPKTCREGAEPGQPPAIGMPWGVEDLSVKERFAKAINAGMDQFGGVSDPAPLIAAAREGLIASTRIDESVRIILRQKFDQGLFEDPFVDSTRASRSVGTQAFQTMADEAQRRSLVLLQNRGSLLPLRAGSNVYAPGIDSAIIASHGLVAVAQAEGADAAIIRAEAPAKSEHPRHFFGGFQREGRLVYKDGDEGYERIKSASRTVPTIAVIYLDRPALLANVIDKAAAVVADFGITDGPLLDILTGKVRPSGRIPFEMPRDENAVARQRPDIPTDSVDPLYPMGFGLTYR